MCIVNVPKKIFSICHAYCSFKTSIHVSDFFKKNIEGWKYFGLYFSISELFHVQKTLSKWRQQQVKNA